MAVAVVEVAAVAAVAARHLQLRLPARELALRAVEVAAHLRQALVADGQPHLLVVDEGVDQVVALADVVRIDERLAEPLAEQAAPHRRLALREDAEERGVLVGLARLRVDRERAHRAAVEPHELRGLDPLQRPLAVRVGVGEHVEVLEQPARRADREELRALEGAAVELLLAEEAAQVLLVVLRRERALLAVDVRHLAQLQHLGELLPLAVAEVGRQHALLRRLLAHERLERREVLVVLKLGAPDRVGARVDERDADEPRVAGVPLRARRLADAHRRDHRRRVELAGVELALVGEGLQVAGRAAPRARPLAPLEAVLLDAPLLLQQREPHHLLRLVLVDREVRVALVAELHVLHRARVLEVLDRHRVRVAPVQREEVLAVEEAQQVGRLRAERLEVLGDRRHVGLVHRERRILVEGA